MGQAVGRDRRFEMTSDQEETLLAMLLEDLQQAAVRVDRAYAMFERAVLAAVAGGCSPVHVMDAARVSPPDAAGLLRTYGLGPALADTH
jgi:hypothetical protein